MVKARCLGIGCERAKGKGMVGDCIGTVIIKVGSGYSSAEQYRDLCPLV